MGCGGSTLLESFLGDNLSEILRESKFLNKEFNPFYKISYNDFEIYLKTIENEKNFNKKIDLIIKNYEFNTIASSLFSDVLNMGNKKFKNIFNENYDYSNDIILIIFLFTSSNENELEKKKLLQKIIFKVSKNSNNEYLTGKLYIIILNLLFYFLFSFIYFFICIPILDNNYRLNKEDIETLLVNKKSTNSIKSKNLNNMINESLMKINKKINANEIISNFLVKIFSPISSLIEESPDVEIIKIEDSKMEEVISNIETIFNIKTFIDTFEFI